MICDLTLANYNGVIINNAGTGRPHWFDSVSALNS